MPCRTCSSSRMTFASSMSLLLVLSAWGAESASAPAAAPAPASPPPPQQQCVDLHLTVLGRSGLQYGTGVLGRHMDASKQPVVHLLSHTDKSHKRPLTAERATRAGGAFTEDAVLVDAYSNAPDFFSVHEVGFLCPTMPCTSISGQLLAQYCSAVTAEVAGPAQITL